MWLFGSRRKAQTEYVSACIWIEQIRVGDYMIDGEGPSYEGIEIIGMLYEYDIYRGQANPQSAEQHIKIEIKAENSFAKGMSRGFLALAPSGHEFTGSVMFLSRPAVCHLVDELQWRAPKCLCILGRRDEGTQKVFDTYQFFLSQENRGLLRFRVTSD